MPPAILGAGCAVHDGETLKLLVRLEGEANHGARVRLMQADLKELEERAQTCEQVAEDEELATAEAFREREESAQHLRGTSLDSSGSSGRNRWLD